MRSKSPDKSKKINNLGEAPELKNQQEFEEGTQEINPDSKPNIKKRDSREEDSPKELFGSPALVNKLAATDYLKLINNSKAEEQEEHIRNLKIFTDSKLSLRNSLHRAREGAS